MGGHQEGNPISSQNGLKNIPKWIKKKEFIAKFSFQELIFLLF